MRKLRLDLDELELESFAAVEQVSESVGTARAFVPQTQQVKCTYFCTYGTCTGLPCAA